MGRCRHPSPCCGRAGTFERFKAGTTWTGGTFYRRCNKCGRPFSYTTPELVPRARVPEKDWNARLRQIRALPGKAQAAILGTVDRLVEFHARTNGITLPESAPEPPREQPREQPGQFAQVIQLAERRPPC